MKSRVLFSLAIAGAAFALAQQNPFAPERVRLNYAPDRTCDLIHVSIETNVDWETKSITGETTNTFAPLRDGIDSVTVHAGPALDISRVSVDGADTSFRREGRDVVVPLKNKPKGKPFRVALQYKSKPDARPAFGSTGQGWHWVRPRGNDASRIGFWIQGWPESNSDWAPTWDFPNDLATSETKTTVPADWEVIGNGKRTSVKTEGGKKTFHYRLMQPHATYLITLCGGPFDVKRDNWQGVELWYVVPRGMGHIIDDSFSDTKDMLDFFSNRLGVKYPWPQYAQDAMYDFGGGMENVSATTLGEPSLTEARYGFREMSSLNSHELAHQWFGDLVTCKDWGDVWLNESFATFFQIAYFEHSHGATGYAWEIEDAMQNYFRESRRYKRPISSKLFDHPFNMLDAHSYPKGAAVLHTLRRQLGDEPFFGGLGRYLKTWKHTPVESAQLRRAMTEFTGIEMEPFWAQWIEKPGHPVIEYSWAWRGEGPDASPGTLLVTVKQLQDTKDGTPVYNIPTEVAFIGEGLAPSGWNRAPIRITKADETFELKVGRKPLAVLLDPDHSFLREMRELNWAESELTHILVSAPSPVDRQEAMRRLLANPTPERILAIVGQIERDHRHPQMLIFRDLKPLADLARPELREFWTKQLDHPNIDRQAQAADALAKLPEDTRTNARFRSMVNERTAVPPLVRAIQALAAWDAKAHRDVFEKARGIKDLRNRVRTAAEQALAKA